MWELCIRIANVKSGWRPAAEALDKKPKDGKLCRTEVPGASGKEFGAFVDIVSENSLAEVGDRLLGNSAFDAFKFFSGRNHILPPGAERYLDMVAAYLRNCPNIRLIVISHTGWSRKDEIDKGLTEKRAKIIAERLISKGIARERISTVGEGSSKPIVPNTTARGRERNNRIEFRILDKK